MTRSTSQRPQSYLVIAFILVIFLANCAEIIISEVSRECDDFKLPDSGFVQATFFPSGSEATNDVYLTIRILSRHMQLQSFCKALRFSGLMPKIKQQHGLQHLYNDTFYALREEFVGDQTNGECDISQRLLHGDEKKRCTDSAVLGYRLVNGRFVYSNGRDVLSFARQEEGGTWVVDTNGEPGKDQGFIYYKSTDGAISPVALGTDTPWHWLQHSGDWSAQPSLRTDCLEHHTKDEVAETASTVGADTIPLHGLTGHMYHVELYRPNDRQLVQSELLLGCGSDADGDRAWLWLDGRWQRVQNLLTLHAYGVAVSLPPVDSGTQRTSTGATWVLYDAHAEPYAARWKVLYRIAVQSIGTAANDVVREDYVLAQAPPSTMLQTSNAAPTVAMLATVEVGAFAWLWWAGPHAAPETNAEPLRSSIQRAFVQCLYAGPRAVFRMWPADRLHAMRWDALHEDVGLLALMGDASDDAALLHRGHRYTVTAWETIGPRVLHYLEQLLGLQAPTPTAPTADDDVSPCFFYHAAPRVPEPLIYAAEVLCVLHGKKALAMVQYVTPSDAQHRHPLVRPLVRAALTAAHALPAVDVQQTILSYRRDSTLILYRTSHEALVQALRPQGQAQALHPVPYPDYHAIERDDHTARLLAEQRAQVYNSAWNGYVLGYPLSLVDAYCEDFHNDLTVHEKRLEAERSRRDVRAFFRSHALQRITGVGHSAVEPIERTAMERIFAAVYKDVGAA